VDKPRCCNLAHAPSATRLELDQRWLIHCDFVISAITLLDASRTNLRGLGELRAASALVPWKGVFRKPGRRQLYFVFACASLLCFVVPASARAQEQNSAPALLPTSLPHGLLATAPPTEASGSVLGTVLDASGASVSGAEVTLLPRGGAQSHLMMSEANGEFNFTAILPGSYFVIVAAKGFAVFTSAEFALAAQQTYDVPDISLSLAAANMEVIVRPTDVIAAEQMRDAEKQRLVGILPNFYTSYVPDAAPMTWKQKFSFATRGTFDPVAMLGVGFAAGVEQANNSFAGYGQGASGYGKRFAAKFADGRSSDYLTHAVFPSLLHQDPRYYYQGTGTLKSRLLHAIGSAFLTRGDDGRTEPNYSYVLGDMCSGALSNLYYPAANRGAHLVFTNAAVGLAGRVGGNLLREFLPKHSTTNVPGERTP
jgi:Carboxypeptidase regulatory-like domain